MKRSASSRCGLPRHGYAIRLAAILTGALAVPALAQAQPVLSTDLVSQNDMVSVSGASRAAPIHRRLDVAFVDLDETRGRLRYGVTFQYGNTFATDPNDYIGHEADHRSLRIDREIFVGATTSLRVHGAWRLVASAGRLQLRMHAGYEDATLLQSFNEPTLMGWRTLAGVERPLGSLVMTLGWQMTRFAGQEHSVASTPTRASASHVMVEIKIAL